MDIKQQKLRYDAAQEMLSRQLAEDSFYEFAKQSWHLVEGKETPFIDGYHIQAICEHLQAVALRQIRFFLCNLPPRCMKPVGQHTMLLRSDGARVAIKDIQIGDMVLTHAGRFKKVLNIAKQGMLPTLKISTFSGREIISALDHPFLTPNGWIEAKDLKVKDVLGTTSVMDDFGVSFSNEEARLIGYFIGDGCLTGTSLNITSCDEVEMQDIEHCCQSMGFVSTRRQYNLNNRPPHHSKFKTRINIKAGENNAREWARNIGIATKNSYTKRVPEKIMKGTFDVIRNFIGAYFACDGTLASRGRSTEEIERNDKALSFCSVNKKMLEDVQHLLMRLGIRSRIRLHSRKLKTKAQGDIYVSYTLEISSQDDLYNFRKQIPIYHSKQNKLNDLNIIRHRFDNNIHPDAIVSIKENQQEICYCLEIEDDHTFTANDIIVHNSTLLSVMFPAWVWLRRSQERFLYSSYAHNLSMRDSVRCRRIIESDWYQLRWGDKFFIIGDQNTKIKFDNNKTGYRMCTSQNSSATGEGGSIIILDDPNNAKDCDSDIVRESRNSWYDGVWSTRLNDPKNDCRIVMQQRIHEKDVSGHIMSTAPDGMWTKLILPMEYESQRKCKTIILPSTAGKIWEDPRTTEGELLWPERIGEVELAQLKSSLGSQYRISGQLQQRPAPEEGGIIKKKWFRHWKYATPPKIKHVIQSWDTALGAKESNCYSACTTWGLFQDENEVMNLILLSLWRGKLEYPELRDMAQRLYRNYLDDKLEDPKPSNIQNIPDVVLVESKMSGISLIQDLHKAGIIATRFDPDKHGDKILRVRLITHFLEAGRVWMPAKPPDYTRLRDYADLMVEQCMPAGTLIYCEDGMRNIENIKVGDMVLTHNGRWRPVINIMKNTTKKLIKIKCRTLDQISLTPNHPVWALTYGTNKKVLETGNWKNAENIQSREYLHVTRKDTATLEAKNSRHDALAIPLLQESNKTHLDMTSWIMSKQHTTSIKYDESLEFSSPNSNPTKIKIPLNYDFGRFCGLYLAEGCTNDSQVRFSFHKKETDYINFIVNFVKTHLSDCNHSIRTLKNCSVISFNMAFHKFFFLEFGHHSHNKRIPEWCWNANKEFWKGIIDGWTQGDGHINTHRKNVQAITTSKTLAYQMKILLASLGITSSLLVRQARIEMIQNRQCECREAYVVTWKYAATKGCAGKVVDDKMYFSIQDKEIVETSCEVYNFEVEEDNSYTTTGGIVHNCGMFPNAESRDLVDTMAQVLLRLRDSGYLTNPKDEGMFGIKKSEPRQQTKRSYY